MAAVGPRHPNEALEQKQRLLAPGVWWKTKVGYWGDGQEAKCGTWIEEKEQKNEECSDSDAKTRDQAAEGEAGALDIGRAYAGTGAEHQTTDSDEKRK